APSCVCLEARAPLRNRIELQFDVVAVDVNGHRLVGGPAQLYLVSHRDAGRAARPYNLAPHNTRIEYALPCPRFPGDQSGAGERGNRGAVQHAAPARIDANLPHRHLRWEEPIECVSRQTSGQTAKGT